MKKRTNNNTHHARHAPPDPQPPILVEEPGVEDTDVEEMQLIERPDGYYWRCAGRARESGPFATRLEAEQNMEVIDDEALEPGETLQEAEAEIGIADWVDPDTGELAEETVSRIEEH